MKLIDSSLNSHPKQIVSTKSDFEPNQSHKRQTNIKKLKSFLNLKDNWNGYGAKPFPKELINRCAALINSMYLSYQPDIFPTGRNSIQFEYEKTNGAYLEIEIYDDRIALLLIDSVGQEFESENVPWEEAVQIINEFYA